MTETEQIEAALLHALRQARFWAERAEKLSAAYVEATGVDAP